MKKYFDDWESRDDVALSFGIEHDVPLADVPTDDAIRFAVYGYEDYSGSALVVFERDGKLYEVNGSHCSCDGLEGQWEPEETTWAALAMREMYGVSREAGAALHALCEREVR